MRKVAHTSEFPFGVYWWILKDRKNLNTFTGDIISYISTKKHNHMRYYSSWDTKWDRIFCRFGSFFVFNPVHPYNPENQNFEEMKKAFGNVIILNLCNKKTRCLLTQIWSPCTDIIFCHFRPFFAFLPNYWPQQLRFGKTPGHITLLHMCNINQDMMYSSCGMKFTRHNFFSHLGQFFALLPPNTLKNKNIKNEKTPEDIILSKCTKNHDHLLYTVPEIWHMTDVIIFILGIRHISKHFSTTSKRS